ncbi:unnamed protein product [Brachionus calyciflorus]|uniref:Tetratricopeptide repeat protein 12 n=1 Tax=Brachionus calyciflorus TaxID=104777 RepID=A0A813PQU0_9BILA|nr:unnamed protein product [Brachionus calyciflorus]
MDLPPSEDLEEFLKKVDEIENVVKGLNSDDNEKVKENLQKADYLIKNIDKETDVEGIKTKTGVNRSVINKYSDIGGKIQSNEAMSQDEFLSALEKDANERYERKKKATQEANELKEKGNEEFKCKNYEKAIEFYTEAIQKVKDIPVIYTNRAQSYNLIGKYDEAISDCNWALRIDEKCTKALIHKGKAYGHLKEFDKALEEFQNAKNIDPKITEIIDGKSLIKLSTKKKLSHQQEESAKIFLDKNKNENTPASNILDILNNKIGLKDQNIWYYSGGLRCLGSLCNDDTTRTLFRTQNGFKLFEEHSIFSNLFNENTKLKKLNPAQTDVLCSIFEFFTLISKECDENLRSIFKLKNFSSIIEKFFKQPNSSSLKLEIVKFFFYVSQNEFGMLQILNNFKHFELLVDLLNMVTNKEINGLDQKIINLVQNLILEEKFQLKLKIEDVKIPVVKICSLLQTQSIISAKNLNYISSLFTCIYALTSLKKFLQIIKECEVVWSESVKFLTMLFGNEIKYEILFNVVVCLLNNICAFKSEFLDLNMKKILDNLIKSSGYQNQQVLTLISNMIQNVSDREKIIESFNIKFVETLVKNVQSKNCLSQSVKTLALLTQNDKKNFRKELIAVDKNLSCLYEIFKDVSQSSAGESVNSKNLNLKKLNETVISNSVLCMSYCVESDDKLAQLLIKTNIMMDLLYLTRDGFNAEMQKNCGILIAKLAKKDERHLHRLRELNGIEILYAALKNANI